MNAPFSSSSQSSAFCPRCGAPGKPVKLVTLQSLLKPDALAQAGSTIYRFCPGECCEVVYFAEGGGRIFFKAELRVQVGVKETAVGYAGSVIGLPQSSTETHQSKSAVNQ